MLGEIPILDFMAYDPGRYYWSAAIMSLIGDDGLISLRVSIYAFQVIGVFAGIWLLIRVSDKADIVSLVLATITLVLWMYPRHKIFDITISILLVSALAYLIEKPSLKRHFICGLSVGMAALVGRNHGVYGVIGALGAITWIAIRDGGAPVISKSIMYWVLGITVAYSPIAILMIAEPSFLNAFLESIISTSDSSKYVKPRVPWTWPISSGHRPSMNAVRTIISESLLMLTVAAPLFILANNTRKSANIKSINPVVLASAFMAIPYSHFLYTHASGALVAQSVHPLLLGGLAGLAKQNTKIRWLALMLLCGVTIYFMKPVLPQLTCKNCVKVDVSGQTIEVSARKSSHIALLKELDNKYAAEGQAIFVTPIWPGAYALLNKKSPVWEIYALFPRDVEFQKKEIRRLIASDPAFILIKDGGKKGIGSLGYRNNHSTIYRYIADNYESSSDLTDGANKSFSLYIKKRAEK